MFASPPTVVTPGTVVELAEHRFNIRKFMLSGFHSDANVVASGKQRYLRLPGTYVSKVSVAGLVGAVIGATVAAYLTPASQLEVLQETSTSAEYPFQAYLKRLMS